MVDDFPQEARWGKESHPSTSPVLSRHNDRFAWQEYWKRIVARMRYEKSRVRPMIDPALGEKEKLRIVVRGFVCVIRIASDGVPCHTSRVWAAFKIDCRVVVQYWLEHKPAAKLSQLSHHAPQPTRNTPPITEGHSE